MKCNEISRNAPRFTCCPGSNLRQLYKSQVLKDGSIKLIDAGFQDTDAFIESFRESCELKTLLARFNAGDVMALQQFSGGFTGDFSEFPDNLGQALEILKTAENAFAYLPKQTKDVYGNDFAKWIQDFGSEEFMRSIGFEKQNAPGAADPIPEGSDTK